MRLLLDTHVWIWTQEKPQELGAETTRQIIDRRQSLFVSTVSTLEIARLVSVGMIEVQGSLDSWVQDTLESLDCRTLEVSHKVAIGAYSLPQPFHKDPADRVIAATARIHDLTLVTAHQRLLAYPHVHTLDARS